MNFQGDTPKEITDTAITGETKEVVQQAARAQETIQVKLDKKAGVGNLHCKVCGQRFQTGINYLSAAVDVYSDWIDACEDVAKDAASREAEDDAKFSSYAASGKAGADIGGAEGGADEDEDVDYGDD
ncbi:hypothetical protein AYO20_10285 [Fonsecaea nubica]|uniref:Transcription elongation factor 1 homolog n=1 Tax=Fonsecaea nubica TaxID=856822 RepID=A0A178C9U1_9EURO|nr:hypothetical protein AYO20_10285 [Fonsecaea nubica]OAL26016.1 hypothetical protein AYO20_10285 [Fonsecaea nubica]